MSHNHRIFESSMTRRSFAKLLAAGSATALGGMLVGCGTQPRAESSAATPSSTASSAASSSAASSAASSVAATTGTAKALIAVFSWSGNTLQVANHLHDVTDAALFRIEPAQAYTTVYNDMLDVAQSEQAADARPALAATVPNWSEYDTVLLGYPVWWYEAPRIVKSFMDAHDFSGKTVHPFATSGGSNISGTIAALEALCPNAQFTEGLTLDGDTVSSHLDEASQWAASKGL